MYTNRRLPSRVCLRLLKRRMERQAPLHLREPFMDEVDRAAWILTMNALVDYVQSNQIKVLQRELEGVFYQWTIAEAWVDCSDARKIAQRYYLRVFRSLLQFIWLSTKGYPKDRFCEIVRLFSEPFAYQKIVLLFSEPFAYQKIESAKLSARLNGTQVGVFDCLSPLLSQAGAGIYEAL